MTYWLSVHYCVDNLLATGGCEAGNRIVPMRLAIHQGQGGVAEWLKAGSSKPQERTGSAWFVDALVKEMAVFFTNGRHKESSLY